MPRRMPKKFASKEDFIIYLDSLLPSNRIIDALKPDNFPDIRPYQLSTPLMGAEIMQFRELFGIDTTVDDTKNRRSHQKVVRSR